MISRKFKGHDREREGSKSPSSGACQVMCASHHGQEKKNRPAGSRSINVLMKSIFSFECIFGEEKKKKIFVGRQRKRDWVWHSCLRNASGGNS